VVGLERSVSVPFVHHGAALMQCRCARGHSGR
jgi:hypothetical protein